MKKLYFDLLLKGQIIAEDVAAALLSSRVTPETREAITAALADPDKTDVLELEIEDWEIPLIAEAVGDYYYDRVEENLTAEEAAEVAQAMDAAFDGMLFESSDGSRHTLHEEWEDVDEDREVAQIKDFIERGIAWDFSGEDPEVRSEAEGNMARMRRHPELMEPPTENPFPGTKFDEELPF